MAEPKYIGEIRGMFERLDERTGHIHEAIQEIKRERETDALTIKENSEDIVKLQTTVYGTNGNGLVKLWGKFSSLSRRVWIIMGALAGAGIGIDKLTGG